MAYFMRPCAVLAPTVRRLMPYISSRSLGNISTSYPTTACGHPLIDVSPLLHGVDSTATIRHLRASLLERGYFYAANVDVLPEGYISGVYDYSRRAHALPSRVKEHYKQRGGTGLCNKTASLLECSSREVSWFERESCACAHLRKSMLPAPIAQIPAQT